MRDLKDVFICAGQTALMGTMTAFATTGDPVAMQGLKSVIVGALGLSTVIAGSLTAIHLLNAAKVSETPQPNP